MGEQEGITASKSGDFAEWYTQVVIRAELADYVPVKGLVALRPDGYAVWEALRARLDERFARLGVRNGFLPTLIPESLLKTEKDHFEGFDPEVFWVTHSGDAELGDRLALRPTSETLAYSLYARWVRSWRDLPLKINFWNTALRAEIKSTKPFLRTSEFLWQEGHTVHASKEEAEGQVEQMLRAYAEVVEGELAVPVVAGRKSESEKFVGAVYTTAIESVMPDGRALQMGTSHFLGRNFSGPFGVKFADKDNAEHLAWQTSWGVSWRLIGAMIMVHGDDKGLVMPPRVAPLQAVIVPIAFKDADKGPVGEASGRLLEALRSAGVRASVDGRDLTPGYKYNDWEMRGVPLRVEVGPRDVKAGSAVAVVRRDGSKHPVALSEAGARIPEMLERIQGEMLEAARAAQESMTSVASDMAGFKKSAGAGFVRAPWCGGAACEQKAKDETGSDIRVIPFDSEPRGPCVVCGRGAECEALFARGY